MTFRGMTLVACLAVNSLACAQDSKVVGWRGDGTGRYPDANPPTEWFLKENGESKNILWKTKLPCYSWSTPIIVGDKIFTRSEPYDLICLNKDTGKILWMHSLPPIVTFTDEDKKTYPGYKAVAGLLEQLELANAQFVTSGWSQDLCKKKYDLQKQLNDAMTALDNKFKLPQDWYVESWTGYTGSTPCSDGQNIYFTSGNGVIACYDLDGNQKWAKYDSVASIWAEHGVANSPTISGNIFVAPSVALHGFDKTTGNEVWQQKINEPHSTSVIPFKFGGTDYVAYAGNCIKPKDGKIVGSCGAGWQPAVFIDNRLYYGSSHVYIYKLEAKSGEELSLIPLVKEEYDRVKVYLPADPNLKLKSEDRDGWGWNAPASPLYDNGLLYCVGSFGWLAVLDTSKEKDLVVYRNYPGFDFKNGVGRKSPGMGSGASPILAGKYIYMLDASGCTIVMKPGREYKQVAKNNIDCVVPEWAPQGTAGYYTGPHQEQTEASPIADGNRIYIRGEQFLYCIGEK